MEDKIDLLIKEALKVRYERTACPSKEEMWNKILVRLRKKRRMDLLKRLRPAIAACGVIVILTGIFFNFQTPVMALAGKVIKSIERFADNTLIIRKSVENGDADNSKRADNWIDDPRINEAQNKVSFKISVPKYMPDGYELAKVDAVSENKEQEAVILAYYDSNDAQDRSKFIVIMQNSMYGNVKTSMNIKIEEDTQIKRRKIKGGDATLINYGDNINKIIWDADNVEYKIDGTVDEKTIIKIAESME